MKWILIIALVVVGILAAITAIEYLTVPIYNLPSFIPGKHQVYGHYHKRGALAALIAIVAFAGAAIIFVRSRRSTSSATPKSSASAGDLLSGSDSDSDPTSAD